MPVAGFRAWLATRVLPLLVLAVGTAGAQTTTGTISGRVTEAGSGQPVPEARVILIGTNLFASTNAEGRYAIRGVPAGAQNVRALRVGFAEQRKPITVDAGQQATLDFALATIAVRLTEVVTTATGEARNVEQGNVISQIDAAREVATQPIRDVSDLLTARAPGVQVLPSNLTGTSSRVRIRGVNSVSLSNDPIYVIDGVRMTSTTGASSISVGGSLVSRVNDINPNDIESIEIVKGPSAATLYGTDAANGVIVITTKKGRAGRPQWTAFVEGGAIQQRNEFPTAYSAWGRRTSSTGTVTVTPNCYLTDATCQRDSITTFNLFDDPETTPYTTGVRQKYGAQLSGGSEMVRFFTSIDHERTTDPLQIPEFDVRRMTQNNELLLDEWRRPNALQRSSFRVNVNAAPTPQLDLGLSTAFVQTDQRLPQTDNNTFGLFSHAYGGPGYKQTTATGSFSGTTPLYGYRAMTPGEIFRAATEIGASRFQGGLNAQYRPLSWLSARANAGVDFTGQTDQSLCRRGSCVGNASRLLGFANNNTVRFYNYSADLGTTATTNPFAWLNSKTTVGAQYVNQQILQNFAGGTTLSPGATTVSAAAVPTSGEASSISKTLGVFVEEAVALRDRLFITGAVRTDQNSAFGTNFQRVFYPKLSASWIISDESWFPEIGFINQLRPRFSYGSSGVQPGPNDALRTFGSNAISVDRVDQAAVQAGAVGNPDLQPERATEFEGGFEARLLGDRLNLDLTYYNKLTEDALISAVIAPSTGAGARTRRENIGSVKNVGVEALITTQLVDRQTIGWDLTLNGSTNRNKIVSMGRVAPQIFTTQRRQYGYPILGFWERKYTYTDANNDGIITTGEIQVDAEQSFLGQPTPMYEVVLTNGLDLFSKKLRLQALVDYKGGYKLENVTEEFRCTSRANCRALYDPTAPLEDQARAVAIRELTGTRRTYAGFIEDGSFIRFRELSLSYSPSEALAARFLRARSATLSLSARNLGFLMKKYSGIDPEMNYGNADYVNEFQTSPTPTVFSVRLNVGF